MTAEQSRLRPGATIGILGGGQLGRMLAIAAAELGFNCHIYCPDPKSPAFAVSAARTVAPYDDEAALAAFAASVDVVTFEFENMPAATALFLAERVAVRPEPGILAIAQDRLSEKELMTSLGIPVVPFAAVGEKADIYSALARTGRPAILKTRRSGYDGKGQALVRAGDDPVAAWRTIGEVPAVLEAFVSFEREISVILARAATAPCAPSTSRRTSTGPASSRAARCRPPSPRNLPTEAVDIADARSPRRSTMSASSLSRCSSFAPACRRGCWSTRSPRASTIPVTGPAMPA